MPRMGLLPLLVASVHGLQLASLLDANRATVNALNPDVSELTRLRFAMAFPDDAAAASAALEEQLAWRAGEGASIVSAAASAVKAATADGGWNNQPVNDAAPHAALVNQYITTNQIVTLSTAEGDLVFCIRAAALDATPAGIEALQQMQRELQAIVGEHDTLVKLWATVLEAVG